MISIIGKELSLKLKKGKYKFVKTVDIDANSLYSVNKPSLSHFVEKYHLKNGDPLLFYNTPIYLFAKSCVDDPKAFARDAGDSSFVQCSMERYNVHTKEYLDELVERMASIVNSIKKHGYAKGKFKNKLIGVVKNGSRYELISGKHRAAACLSLGIKKVKCNLYKDISPYQCRAE